MLPVADIWDALGGGAIAAIVGAIGLAYVRVYRTRHEVNRTDRTTVIEEQQKYMAAQTRQIERLDKRLIVAERGLRESYDRERRCQRRVDRLRLWTMNQEHRLSAYEAAMHEVGLPTFEKSRFELDLIEAEEADNLIDLEGGEDNGQTDSGEVPNVK